MDASATSLDVAVWADGVRVELVRRVVGLMPELRVVALGGPRKGQLADLADEWGVKVQDDLRKMVIDHVAGFLFIATGEGAGTEELKQAKSAGMAVVALDPLDDDDVAVNGMVFPTWRGGPAWLSAAEPLQVIGKVRSARAASMGPRGAGTLFARLWDAVDMLVHLMGVPVTVDAALTGGPGEPPEELAALAGDMTGHLRFGGGAAAVLHVSDRAATWSRRLTVLGDGAQLTLDDASYTLTDPTGKTLDSLSLPHDAADPADLIAKQWRRMIEGSGPPRPADPRAVRSCCQAALLSCRTGQLESPGKLLEMRGV